MGKEVATQGKSVEQVVQLYENIDSSLKHWFVLQSLLLILQQRSQSTDTISHSSLGLTLSLLQQDSSPNYMLTCSSSLLIPSLATTPSRYSPTSPLSWASISLQNIIHRRRTHCAPSTTLPPTRLSAYSFRLNEQQLHSHLPPTTPHPETLLPSPCPCRCTARRCRWVLEGLR